MKRILFFAVIPALVIAGCNRSRKSDKTLLTLHQADSLVSVSHAWSRPYKSFMKYIDSLENHTSSGNKVSDEYFFHSMIYGYNLNHSLRIPYEGFTTDPDYHVLAEGTNLKADSLLKNEEYCKFLERYLDLTAKYMIEAGQAPDYKDNLFINTQFYIANHQLSGEVRQYALCKIMLLQINTFGIDNIGEMFTNFKKECTDAAYLRAVEQALQKEADIYSVAEKLVYKVVGSDSLNAYVTYPERRLKTMPVIVLVHEGGWYNGQPGENMQLAKLFNQLGFVAISVEYRLKARQNATPVDGLMDVKSAVRWVRENAGQLGIDPQRLVVGGVSAGGQLAAATALIPGYGQPGEDTSVSTMPEAVILWSGCVDPTVDAWFNYCLRGKDDPVNLSPTNHVKPGAPPFLIFQGTHDEFLDYHTHIAFQKKLENAGDYCKLVIYKGKSHFQVLDQNMKPVIEEFLKTRFLP